MRIIDTTRRDYYDGVQRDGQDLTCIYIRKEQELSIPSIFSQRSFGFYHPMSGCYKYLIGFCGNLHPLLIGSEYIMDVEPPHHYRTHTYVSYDPEHFKQNWLKYGKKRRITKQHQKDLDDFFGVENSLWDRNAAESFFREHKVPIFVVRTTRRYESGVPHDDLVLNPLLKEYQFQRVVDTYQTFQKIHQYLSGVLGGESKPIPEIDDKTKADIHGFDSGSFRTPKGEKPKRKRR